MVRKFLYFIVYSCRQGKQNIFFAIGELIVHLTMERMLLLKIKGGLLNKSILLDETVSYGNQHVKYFSYCIRFMLALWLFTG